MKKTETIMKFMNKVSPEPNSGCWIWTGKCDTKGYGRFNYQGAHRASYELFKGPLTPGLYVCHTCDVTICVNPDHLFEGTNRENQLDCNRKGRRPKMMGTHCPRGHELSGWNLILEKRKDPLRPLRRRCRECVYHEHKAKRAKRRAAELLIELTGRGF